MKWEILESGKQPAQFLMAKDEQLLGQLEKPLLHLYEWDGPSLTYGYFTDPFQYLNPEALQKHRINMARRPTGGGIIFHLTDFAFSILVPHTSSFFSMNTLENYAFVNRLVAQALVPFLTSNQQTELLGQESNCEAVCHGFCMAKPTRYDIMIEGKKVGGAAQRRTKQGYLHQGSISLALPSLTLLEEVLNGNQALIQAMRQHTFAFIEQGEEITKQLNQMRLHIKQSLIDKIRRLGE